MYRAYESLLRNRSTMMCVHVCNDYAMLEMNCLTSGFIGLTMEMSVPSALCRLESNTFRFLFSKFSQMTACLACRKIHIWHFSHVHNGMHLSPNVVPSPIIFMCRNVRFVLFLTHDLTNHNNYSMKRIFPKIFCTLHSNLFLEPKRPLRSSHWW